MRREIKGSAPSGSWTAICKARDVTRIAEFFRSDTGRMLMADPHRSNGDPVTIGIPVRAGGWFSMRATGKGRPTTLL